MDIGRVFFLFEMLRLRMYGDDHALSIGFALSAPLDFLSWVLFVLSVS